MRMSLFPRCLALAAATALTLTACGSSSPTAGSPA